MSGNPDTLTTGTDEAAVEGLRALADKATPRPWIAEPWGMDTAVRRADGSRMNIGDALYHPQYAADSEFIAAARNDLSDLLDDLDRLKAVADEARLVGQWFDAVDPLPAGLRGELHDLYRHARAALLLEGTPDAD